MTPVHYAAHRGHKDLLIYLLSKTADSLKEDNLGCSFLHSVVLSEEAEIVSAVSSVLDKVCVSIYQSHSFLDIRLRILGRPIA